jgi:serine/threonine protein phosphatase 1
VVNRLAFVGDIHGEAARLREFLSDGRVRDRQIIFLGDYVNRGPCSREVVNLVSRAVSEGHVALLGNHDHALVAYLEGRLSFVEFASMGGAATIRSYVPRPYGDVHSQLRSAIPDEHKDFFRRLGSSWQSFGLLASHVGYDPQDRSNRTLEVMALQSHPGVFYDLEPPADLVVCGHYRQFSRQPYVSERLVCLDTDCGSGGPLSVFLWPDRSVLQF